MKYMIWIILCVVLVWSSWAFGQEVDKAAIADAEVSRFIDHWTEKLPAKWRKMAYSHKASVVNWSLEYRLDPLLVARLISLESSWRSWVVGKRGEIGLMQINNDAIKQKYPNVKTNPDENIRAGCELLRDCIDKCPDLKSAIGCYGTGHCTDAGSWLEKRYERHLKDIEMFRKGKE